MPSNIQHSQLHVDTPSCYHCRLLSWQFGSTWLHTKHGQELKLLHCNFTVPCRPPHVWNSECFNSTAACLQACQQPGAPSREEGGLCSLCICVFHDAGCDIPLGDHEEVNLKQQLLWQHDMHAGCSLVWLWGQGGCCRVVGAAVRVCWATDCEVARTGQHFAVGAFVGCAAGCLA